MNNAVRKFAFYAKTQEIIDELEKVPSRQMSRRLSELVEKGLNFEKQEELKQAYSEYAIKLSEEERGKNGERGERGKNGERGERGKNEERGENLDDNQIMSKSLFEDEDEIENWY